MSLRPRRVITGLRTCAHGGINNTELKARRINPKDIIDFSISTNPFMPPPGIKEILSGLPIEQYPDSQATVLREKLARRLGITPENILAGNGTTELIRLIAMTYFRRGDRTLILEPTYGEYEPACRMASAKTVKYRAKETNNFTPKIEDIVDLILKHQPRGVFICNPNNPTGKYLGRPEIEGMLNAIGDGLLILDEAYIAFVEESWNSLELTKRENVVVLRSMTKDFGMPGLRLGYAVADKGMINDLRLALPPWNVNIAAQKVGEYILEKDEYLKQSLQQVREAKRFLNEKLTLLDFKVLPSDANYFIVKAGNATKFRDSLLEQGIQVRDCTSFGLAEYVRIAPRTMPECHKLVAAIENMQEAGKI